MLFLQLERNTDRYEPRFMQELPFLKKVHMSACKTTRIDCIKMALLYASKLALLASL